MGWDSGTLEFTSPIRTTTLDHSIRYLLLKLRTSIARSKMYPSDSEPNETVWKPKRDRNISALESANDTAHVLSSNFVKAASALTRLQRSASYGLIASPTRNHKLSPYQYTLVAQTSSVHQQTAISLPPPRMERMSSVSTRLEISSSRSASGGD